LIQGSQTDIWSAADSPCWGLRSLKMLGRPWPGWKR